MPGDKATSKIARHYLICVCVAVVLHGIVAPPFFFQSKENRRMFTVNRRICHLQKCHRPIMSPFCSKSNPASEVWTSLERNKMNSSHSPLFTGFLGVKKLFASVQVQSLLTARSSFKQIDRNNTFCTVIHTVMCTAFTINVQQTYFRYQA